MTSTSLTLAGLAITLAIAWANLRPWWKGGHEGKALIPFGGGFGLGALASACTGGILGWLAGGSITAANTGGGKGVKTVTGTPTAGGLTRGHVGALTPEGAVIVFLIAVGMFLTWRAAGKKDKRRMIGGLFCGATLCATAGVAGAMAWFPDLVNTAGEQLRGAVEGAGIL